MRCTTNLNTGATKTANCERELNTSITSFLTLSEAMFYGVELNYEGVANYSNYSLIHKEIKSKPEYAKSGVVCHSFMYKTA